MAASREDPTARPDCETLLNAVMPLAVESLEKHGEFFPFGATLSPDGAVAIAGAFTGAEHPPSSELMHDLETQFRSGARQKSYRATALVYDARITPPGHDDPTDAVAIRLDHLLDYSVVLFFPYKLNADSAPTLDDPIATPGENQIFSK